MSTVYAAPDPRQGFMGPLEIGLLAGANVLSVLWWFNEPSIAAYWVGPLMGGAVDGLVYDYVSVPSPNSEGVGV